jgi:hypothetical protein
VGRPVSPPAVRPAPDFIDTQWPRHPPWDACPRPVWPGQTLPGEPGRGRRVLIVGDSLTRESRDSTTTGLRSSGWTPTYRCWGSRRLDWGIEQIRRARSLHQLPDHVIVALGTNDISWETPQTTTRRVHALLDAIGRERQVLWVDLHLTRSSWLNARADWFNDLISDLAHDRPNVSVIAWHRVARGHDIHGFDGIHYGPYGYRLRAQTVVAGLNDVALDEAALDRDGDPTGNRAQVAMGDAPRRP